MSPEVNWKISGGQIAEFGWELPYLITGVEMSPKRHQYWSNIGPLSLSAAVVNASDLESLGTKASLPGVRTLVEDEHQNAGRCH